MYLLYTGTADERTSLKKGPIGTSLAVQWSTAGGTGSIPGRGTKISYASQWGQKKKRPHYHLHLLPDISPTLELLDEKLVQLEYGRISTLKLFESFNYYTCLGTLTIERGCFSTKLSREVLLTKS